MDLQELKFTAVGQSKTFEVSIDGQCEGDASDIKVRTTNLGWATTSRTDNNITVTCTATSASNGYIYLDIGDFDCGEQNKITCIAPAPPPPSTCVCDNLHLYGLGREISDAADDNATVATYTIDNNCVRVTGVEAVVTQGESDWISNVRYSGGNILAKVKQNTSTTLVRAADIRISGETTDTPKETCTSYAPVSVTQKKKEASCQCGDSNFDLTEIVWQSSEIDPRDKTYDPKSGCIVVTKAESHSEHFGASADTVNHKIVVWPKGTNTTDARIPGQISISYSADGVSCNDSKFNVYHNADGCGCGILNFKVDGQSGSLAVFDNNAYGVTCARTVSYTVEGGQEDCIDGIISAYTTNPAFSSESVSSNSIKVWPIAPNTTRQKVTGYLNYWYKLKNGKTCDGSSDAVELVQVESDYCPCTPINDCVQKTFPIINPGGGGPYFSYDLAYVNVGEGCGDFEQIKDIPSSVREWFNIQILNVGGSSRKIRITLKNGYSQELVRTYTAKVVFRREYGGIDLNNHCPYDFEVTQTSGYVDCTIISKDNMKVSSGDALSYISGVRTIGSLGTGDGRTTYRILKNADVITDSTLSVPSSAQSWLTNLTLDFDNYNNVIVKGSASTNDSGSDRETYVTLTFDEEKMTEKFGICCVPADKKFKVLQYKQSSPPTPTDPCSCRDSGSTFSKTVSYANGVSAYTFVGNGYSANCFNEGSSKYILASSAKTEIAGSDTDYQPITYYSSWLSGYVEDYAYSEEYYGRLHMMFNENDSTKSRTAIFYVVIKLKDGDCFKKVEFTQEGKVANCETLNASIKDYGTYPISFSGANNNSFAYTSNLLVPNSKLSGATIQGTTASWLRNIHNTNAEHVAADFDNNIATSGDGWTSARTTTVQAFFVDENNNKIKFGTETCNGRPITVLQSGYKGACAILPDMTDNNIQVIYDGYGELRPDGSTHWSCTDPGFGTVPAYHKTNGTISLFGGDLIDCVTEFNGKTVPCYALSAKCTDNLISSVYTSAVTDSSYVIRGTVNENTKEVSTPVSIDLYLMRYDYSDGGRKKYTGIHKTAGIMIMPENKDCSGQPIT